MGFEVDHKGAELTAHERGAVTDMRAHLHDVLDQLLARALHHGGAEAQVSAEDEEGNRVVLRLTLCDFTDQKVCPFCDGTGVDGS